jgi:hypothetical protein
MTFEFPTVLNSDETDPDGRFPPPASDASFHWWKWATPAPTYRICVVKIIAIETADKITVKFFNVDGQLDSTEVQIDLSDQDSVWRTLPTTIGTLPSSLGQLGSDTCAVLCVTDKVLGWTPLQPGVFRKYPFAEDSTESVKRMAGLMQKVIRDLIRLMSAVPSPIPWPPSLDELRKEYPDLGL